MVGFVFLFYFNFYYFKKRRKEQSTEEAEENNNNSLSSRQGSKRIGNRRTRLSEIKSKEYI